MVISGDITQIDLEKPKKSGLLHAIKILRGIEEIGFIEFAREDICRHPIVEKIVAGKLDKYYSLVCLVEQPFVKEQELSVTKWLAAKSKDLGDQLVIRRFARYQLGVEAG